MTSRVGEFLEVLEGFRSLPAYFSEAIHKSKDREGGISAEERSDLLIGVGRLVEVMRQVADELEVMMRKYETEGA